MKRNIRKWSALIIAIILYFVVHEGAHFLYAASTDTFRRINFMWIGVQIETFSERLSEIQLGILCLLGPAAAVLYGYALVLAARLIARSQSKLFRAAAYYTSIVLLMTDPLYLSVVYPFVGGGDMNGIALIFPETAVRVVAGMMAAANVLLIIKYLLPIYREAYQRND